MAGDKTGGCVCRLWEIRGERPADNDSVLLPGDWTLPHWDDQLQDGEQRLQTLDSRQLRLCQKFQLAGGEQSSRNQIQLADCLQRGEHSEAGCPPSPAESSRGRGVPEDGAQ